MMLSTLSCAVMGPGAAPPLPAHVSLAFAAPAIAPLPSVAVPDGWVIVATSDADPAQEPDRNDDPSLAIEEAQVAHEETPAAAPVEEPPLVVVVVPPPSREDPVRQAVRDHLMRYRSRSGLTDAELGKLARVIVDEARRHRFDPGLVLAVMHVESRYDTFAVSPKDAMGLMQILPSTGAWMADKMRIPWDGPQMLFDPFVNVRIGVAYLRELTDRYGSIRTALTAYNWGPGAIDKRIERGAPLPNIYAQLVMDALDRASNRS